MLSPEDYQEFSWKYINQIVEALAPEAHVCSFAKGCWYALEEMTKSKVSALELIGQLLQNWQEKFTNNSITFKEILILQDYILRQK